MESKYTRRNRYGENLGSVKSRIQAREGTKKDDVNNSAKLKEVRSRTDARAFRNAEGVRSRMNKFCEKTSVASPKANESPRTFRKENSDKLRGVNGDVSHSPKTERRAKGTEKETETRTTSSKYTREYRSTKLETNGIETKNEEKEVPEQEVDAKVEKSESPAPVEADQIEDTAIEEPAHPDNEPSQDDVTKSDREEEKDLNATNDDNVNQNNEEISQNDQRTPSPAPAESNDFISSFASPRASRAPKTEVQAIDVSEDKASSRERRVRNRREKAEETSRTNEQPSSRLSDKSEMRLERLNDSSLDETPSRRRRRARKAFDSARSSADSSLVSTPDCESTPTPGESASTPKTPESPVVPDAKPESPSAEQNEEEVVEIPTNPEVGNHVDDDLEQSLEVAEEPATTEEPECADTSLEIKDSASADDLDETVVEETTEPENPEPVTDKVEEAVAEVATEQAAEEAAVEESSCKGVEYTMDNLDECKDLSVLEKMLDSATEYDVRRKIRAAIRALKKAGVTAKGKEASSTTSTWQSRATKTQTTTKTDRTTSRTATTTKREVKETRAQRSGLSSPSNGEKENKVTPADPKSLAEKYGLSSETKKDKAGAKKTGSIFDREEEPSRKSGSRLDLERRQAERKREMMRNRAPPSSAASKDARKKFVAKLEDESGSPKVGSGIKASKSPTSVVPNANNVKNMLLRWCQAKTRGYEHVDITNYSNSWANGMAFCALTHNFFPDAFDFSKLDPSDKAHNFKLAFDTAEKRGEIPPLLDVVDLVRMDEPDWKCIYTYLTEFYKHIRELGMT